MVKNTHKKWTRRIIWAGVFLVSLIVVAFSVYPPVARAENERVITVYHDGIEQTIVTNAKTVAQALDRAHVTLNKYDSVEPAADTVLLAPAYNLNVYRARPVTVVDGIERYTVMTSHTSAREIVQAAGLQLYDEDTYDLSRIDNFVADAGVGLKLTLHRAILMNLVLYGKPIQLRTQAKTVGELMEQKQIVLGAQDGTNLPPNTPITPGTTFEVWRNGVQTITNEEEIAFPIKQVRDADHPAGYKAISVPGVKGKKEVTYQIEMKNGQEVSRKVIQSVAMQQPKEQIEIVGATKPGNGLTKSKGVDLFVDSQGVGHRETYYDLPMGSVMRACGGTYSVRADGAKVDQDGYVLIAANLSRYPRCSVVETSLGLGKVYDTGGFVTVYPNGFDLATDWSNNDGK
jgi:uncharacterized protein YabE (DUF348 family)